MVHRDIRSSCFSRRIWLLTALVFGSTVTGCKDSLSDFEKEKQAQAKAVASLTQLGARIKKLEKKGMQGWEVDLSQVLFNSAIAGQLQILGPFINVLNLSKTSINDRQLGWLVDRAVLASVMELYLNHNPDITDHALESLEALIFLSDIDLTGTQVTEAGIARLREKRKAMDISPDNLAKNTSIPKSYRNLSLVETINKKLTIRH